MLLEHRLFNPKRTPWMIALLAAVAALLGVFSMPVLDRDEARFAQASAQMVETGDLIEIRFQDTPRHKKPIGIYWMQSAALALTTGPEAREIWAYRLPSVLGAVLAALSAYGLGHALYGRRIAILGSALFAVSLLLGSEGGIAKTDAMLTGLTGLSLLALAKIKLSQTPKTRRVWAVLMWGAVALGTLVKGPIAPMLAGLAVLTLCAFERRIIWLKVFFYWPGPLLAAVIILPWLIGVQIATDGAFIREAVFGDMAPKAVSGHEGHGAPPGAHLLLVSLLFMPATLTVPAGLHALIQDWRSNTPGKQSAIILVAMLLPGWLVFELLPTKLVHYTLPLFPALAVIAGLGFERWKDTPGLWRGLGLACFALASLIAAGLPMALAARFEGPVVVAGLGGSLLTGLALTSLISVSRNQMQTAFITALVFGLSWHLTARTLVAPALTPLFPSEQVADHLETLREDQPSLAVYSTYTEPSLVFLTGGQVQHWSSDTLLAHILESPVQDTAPALYVIDQSRWPDSELERLDAWLEMACDRYSVDGLNYSRGDETRLWIARTGCEEGRSHVAQD